MDSNHFGQKLVKFENNFFGVVVKNTAKYIFQTSMANGPSSNQSGGSGHQPGSQQGQPGGGLGHGTGPLSVAIVHDIPLHAHLMPPLSHHAGHLSNHHQVNVVSLEVNCSQGTLMVALGT